MEATHETPRYFAPVSEYNERVLQLFNNINIPVVRRQLLSDLRSNQLELLR